jgi:hypothetical protein
MTFASHELAFLAAGLLAVASIVAWWRARRFLARVLRTQGRITHFDAEESERWRGEGQGSDTEISYRPHVEFELPDGARVKFKSRTGKGTQALQGSPVTVVYDPASPASSAEIEGAAAWFVAWGGVILNAALALAALLAGFLVAKG